MLKGVTSAYASFQVRIPPLLRLAVIPVTTFRWRRRPSDFRTTLNICRFTPPVLDDQMRLREPIRNAVYAKTFAHVERDCNVVKRHS